jgi:hypothetical protein
MSPGESENPQRRVIFLKPFGTGVRRIRMKAQEEYEMGPLRIITILTVALIFLSYSIPIACDDKAAKENATFEAVNTTTEAPAAPVAATPGPATKAVKQSMAVLKASVRVGTNIARVLTRAAVHTIVTAARTAYHTVSALS